MQGMPTVTEADIFSRVIGPSNPTLTPEAAAALLQLGYSESDHARLAELAQRSNAGSLTDDER
jgi:Holliday junction resolvasome RuvABC DNA-binding subunit